MTIMLQTPYMKRMNKWTDAPMVAVSIIADGFPLIVIYTSSIHAIASAHINAGSITVWYLVLHSSYSSLDPEGWWKNPKQTIWVVSVNLKRKLQIIKSFGLRLKVKILGRCQNTQCPASSSTCISTPPPSSAANSSAVWILWRSSRAHLCKLRSAFRKLIWTPLGTFSTILLNGATFN